MDHINSICRQEDYPIVVENSPTLGNHAKAERDIPEGEGFLRAVPYAAEVFDNYRKRMCHVCLLYHNRGSFTYRCLECDQVYYCSQGCKDFAMDPLLGAHPKICRAFRKLATWNSDRHTKSIIKLLLQVLMNHWRERQGYTTAYRNRKLFHESNNNNSNSIKEEEVQTEGESSDLVDALNCKMLIKDKTSEPSGESKPEIIENPTSFTEQQSDLLKIKEYQEPIENDFYDVLRLQSHFEDWDEEDTKDWNKQSHIVISLLEMASLTEMATEQGGPLKVIDSTDVKKLISSLESNAFGMFDRSKSKPVCFGRAIYPIASFFNHSCECNSTAVQADGSMEEITGEDVVDCIQAEQSTTSNAPSSLSTSSSKSSLAENSNDTPVNELDNVQSDISKATAVTVDPYDTRIGEFRMMTFYSIKDIEKAVMPNNE
ncbi:hypothetical protein BGZ76_003314 [Entomortierella beljakovae]|nr:hypothetical protein BGZ76_003314 [Entomortierella beljakovae]